MKKIYFFISFIVESMKIIYTYILHYITYIIKDC